MKTGILNRDLEVDMSGRFSVAVGAVYAQLSEKDEEGRVFALAVQTIQATPEQLYILWKDMSLFPRWQEHVVSVTATGTTSSRWVIGDPKDAKGKRIEFDSETVVDIPGQKIVWESVSGEVDLSGSVTFDEAPSGRGTLVELRQSFKVPLGLFGNALVALAQRSPRQTVIEDLRHFKQLSETGEIPSVEGQPHGPRGLSADIKGWMYGESNSTPPGTSEE